MRIQSVNVGRAVPVPYTDAPSGTTGIDKRAVPGPVQVAAPGPKGTGASGVDGDDVCDLRFHGGDDRAVYAFAREDLDAWEQELRRALPNGSFGENLTTSGLDVSGALIGERWRVGSDLLVEVTGGRLPCRTFAAWLGEEQWTKRFTRVGRTGAMLRVLAPGAVRGGDTVSVVHRPDHDITTGLLFRACTLERELLPGTLVAADAMESEQLQMALAYARKYGHAEKPATARPSSVPAPSAGAPRSATPDAAS
ncbi:MOSC domain-containing protein [Streptomyces sulphureus]|uniref:MOSC domain-containing protein n=1 Tax=Streptomyces sulphureus TaxID=47758 RepID=UPI000D0AABB8|nr:MOSC domain-containing protein [Streptomyces sulphureus]